MSFSSEIKKELCSVRELPLEEKTAMLYGMFFAGKTLENCPVIRTDSPELAAAASELAESVFPNARCETKRFVKTQGSSFTFSVRSPESRKRLGSLSAADPAIDPAMVGGDDSAAGAFLRGVFLCCGSVTDPAKEYHLEMVLPENSRTDALLRFIAEHGMTAKLTVRGKARVIYIKESELIEDLLTYIGAGNFALEIMRVKVEKDLRNRANRSVNCDSANLDKTVAASEKSRRDIEYLLAETGFEGLSPELRETARLRLENPESSLSELCGMFSPPISRSGLDHRLKKLSRIAGELKERSSK